MCGKNSQPPRQFARASELKTIFDDKDLSAGNLDPPMKWYVVVAPASALG